MSNTRPWPSANITLTTILVTIFATIYSALVAKALEPPMLDHAEDLFRRCPFVETLFEYLLSRLGGLMTRCFTQPTRDLNTPRMRARVFKFLLVLLIGQLTTSIVAIFTPSTVTFTKPYSLELPGPSYFILDRNENANNFPCTGMALPGVNFLDLTYRWPLENGSIFMTRFRGRKGCTASRVFPLVSSIASGNRSLYAYQDSGVAVHKSAMGAPETIFRGSAVMELIALHGDSIFKTEQCVPVLARNPVTCERRGSLSTEGLHNVNFTFDREGLSRSGIFHYRNLTTDSVMLNYLYTGTHGTSATVGRGVMGFSGITDPNNKTKFAADLARTMNEPDPESHQQYTVVCVLDATNSFEYRTVALHMDNRKEEEGGKDLDFNGYTRSLSADWEPCTPETETVGFPHFAAAMVAQYLPVMEGFPLDGYISSILRLATSNNKLDFAFNNSNNALEDVLGIIAALGVSTMNSTDGVASQTIQGKASVDVTGFQSGTAATRGYAPKGIPGEAEAGVYYLVRIQ
ncbi:hypothetical protein OQA88_8877 [Cercophora sp. LCS_1]